MAEDDFIEKFERKKADSTLQVLFKVARLANEWALGRVNAAQPGQPTLRASHTSLLPHIGFEGTRITALAERLGITKQAVSELVGELEAMDLVERTPDPSDGRAKLIRYSEKGQQSLHQGVALLKSLEEEMARVVGEEKLADLNETLSKLLVFLESK